MPEKKMVTQYNLSERELWDQVPKVASASMWYRWDPKVLVPWVRLWQHVTWEPMGLPQDHYNKYLPTLVKGETIHNPLGREQGRSSERSSVQGNAKSFKEIHWDGSSKVTRPWVTGWRPLARMPAEQMAIWQTGDMATENREARAQDEDTSPTKPQSHSITSLQVKSKRPNILPKIHYIFT